MINIEFKNYRITADDRNFTVRKAVGTNTNAKTGEVVERTALVGYYPTMGKALVAIRHNMVMTGDDVINSVEAYIKALEQAGNELKTIVTWEGEK